MTTRTLPREDWHRLAGTELETIHPLLPAEAQVVIVEAHEQIVACWALFPLWHVEGVWTHPDYRGQPGVVFRLLGAMKRAARSVGARAVTTAAVSPDVEAILERLRAVRLDGRHYALNVEN